MKGAIVGACLVTLLAPAAPARAAKPEPAATRPAMDAERGPSANGLAEAMDLVRRKSIVVTNAGQIDDAAMDTAAKLRSYLSSRDFFSDYLTRVEYDRLKLTQRPEYAGVGLELQKTRAGDVVCFPTPSSPAQKAGIKAGERLLAVDGQSVKGLSLPTLVGLAGGRIGTTVRIETADTNGRRRSTRVKRSNIVAPAPRKERQDGVEVIRVPSFAQNTKGDLAFLLQQDDRSDAPVVIDLRGNTGGDFYAAVDSAMLFLAHGDAIVSVRDRSGLTRYTSTLERRSVARKVVIWQDELTASAAEVFVAALVENHRAVSIGRKSFGKGTRQDIFELGNGDALILTTGYLQGPDGIEFDGEGIAPTASLPVSATGAGFMKKTFELAMLPRR